MAMLLLPAFSPSTHPSVALPCCLDPPWASRSTASPWSEYLLAPPRTSEHWALTLTLQPISSTLAPCLLSSTMVCHPSASTGLPCPCGSASDFQVSSFASTLHSSGSAGAPPSLRFQHCLQSHRFHLGHMCLWLRLSPPDLRFHPGPSSPLLHLGLHLSCLHLCWSGSWFLPGYSLHRFHMGLVIVQGRFHGFPCSCLPECVLCSVSRSLCSSKSPLIVHSASRFVLRIKLHSNRDTHTVKKNAD